MVSEKGQQQAECKFELTGAISELDSTDLNEKLDNRRGRNMVMTLFEPENRRRGRTDCRINTCKHTHACVHRPQSNNNNKNNNKNSTTLSKRNKGHTLL